MTQRSLSNMLLVVAVVQILQAFALGWLSIEVSALRHEIELDIASKV